MRVEGKMNSTLCCSVLEEDQLPFGAETFGEEWTFPQDRASGNLSNYTKNWLKSKNVNLLELPTKSLDLNIIRNA